jgi:hypothetical protein
MDETYTLGLSMLDFVPPLAFLVGAVFLWRLAAREGGRTSATLMGVGTGLVFLGGALKAIWKLLYSLGVGDFALLSDQQFALLAPGFLLMFISTIQLLRSGKRAQDTAVVGMAVWKIPLMVVMTISSIGAYGVLSYLGFRRRRPWAGLLFIATVVLTLGMAGMAGGEQSITRQWIEEGVNSASQIAMALASCSLYRQSRSSG